MDAALTPPELKILQLLANGHGSKAIAHRLNKSLFTITDQKKTLFKKLGVHTSAHAVAQGFRKELIT